MSRLLPVIPFLAPYIVLFLAFFGIAEGGFFSLSALLFIFGVHPLLDWLIGPPHREGGAPSEGPAWLHTLLLRAYLPAQTLLLGFTYSLDLQPDTFTYWGAALSLGAATGGMGITIAHELIHRTRPLDHHTGALLLVEVNYGHFKTEHLLGHHVWVGTPKDPATARFGESLFQFLPRTLLGSFRNALRLKPALNTGLILLQVALGVGILITWGSPALGLHLLQSVFAILLLETVNYIEHYGLSRKELRPGVFEKVNETHSWNSLHRMTNWFLFNLGRHAEHHAHPRVPYQKLKSTPRPRTFPLGYSTMVLLAWVPPLWRALFHGNTQGRPGLLTRSSLLP